MKRDWWHMPGNLPNTRPELDCLLEQVLQQFYFFHVRTYLFLPFLGARWATSPEASFAAAACREPCRQALERYLILRMDTLEDGERLFDCKTSDFVAFVVSVALLLALSATGPTHAGDADRYRQDRALILSIEQAFDRDARQEQGMVAAQCRDALAALRRAGEMPKSLGTMTEVFIPLLGKVQVKQPQLLDRSHPPMPAGIISATKDAQPDAMAADLGTPANMDIFLQTEYMLMNEDFGLAQWVPAGSGAIPVGPSTDFSITAMDLDQDWSKFAPIHQNSFNPQATCAVDFIDR